MVSSTGAGSQTSEVGAATISMGIRQGRHPGAFLLRGQVRAMDPSEAAASMRATMEAKLCSASLMDSSVSLAASSVALSIMLRTEVAGSVAASLCVRTAAKEQNRARFCLNASRIIEVISCDRALATGEPDPTGFHNGCRVCLPESSYRSPVFAARSIPDLAWACVA